MGPYEDLQKVVGPSELLFLNTLACFFISFLILFYTLQLKFYLFLLDEIVSFYMDIYLCVTIIAENTFFTL